MDDVIATTDCMPGISEAVARERIITFAEQFGREHLDLACHAAFPLVLTPDMLYQIWAIFVPQAPWIAVADVLLSSLCSEVAYELYEMDVTIRNLLLKQLQDDARFGQAQLDRLAMFLRQYVVPLANSENLDDQNLAMTQQWAALVYTHSEEAIEQIVGALQNLDQQNSADTSPYDPLHRWAVLMTEKKYLFEKRNGLQSHMSRNPRLVFPSVALPKRVKHHVTECLVLMPCAWRP